MGDNASDVIGIAAALVVAATGRAEISFWSGFAHPQVYVMRSDGTGTKALTNLYSAKRGAWSPDGRRIAFDGRFYETLSDFDIGVMNADGSGLRRITHGPARDVMAAWSPDGRWLAFSRRRTETDEPDVWLVRPNGRDAHKLVRGGAPAWSPDGRWIAFDAPGGVWTVHPDGSGRRRIVTGDVGSLKWSPDGRRVAYTDWQRNTSEIYVARVDGSSPRRLTRNAIDDFEPAWSPDGRRILYTHGRDNAHAVFTMKSDGSSKRRLTRGGDSWATSWRPRLR